MRAAAAAGIEFEETSAHSTEEDDVEKTHAGYHLLGGVEVRCGDGWLRPSKRSGRRSRTRSGMRQQRGERVSTRHDLGGLTLRVKIVIGR